MMQNGILYYVYNNDYLEVTTMNDIESYKNVIETINRDSNLTIYQKEDKKKALLEALIDSLLTTDNDQFKNLAALIKEINFFQKFTGKSYYLYCRKIAYIIDSKKYREQYTTLEDFCYDVLGKSYRTVKEQLDVYRAFKDELHSSAEIPLIEPTKFRPVLPLLKRKDISDDKKREIRQTILENVQTHSASEMKNLVKFIKKELSMTPEEIEATRQKMLAELSDLSDMGLVYSPEQKRADEALFKKEQKEKQDNETENKTEEPKSEEKIISDDSHNPKDIIQYAVTITDFINDITYPEDTAYDFVEDEKDQLTLFQASNLLKSIAASFDRYLTKKNKDPE